MSSYEEHEEHYFSVSQIPKNVVYDLCEFKTNYKVCFDKNCIVSTNIKKYSKQWELKITLCDI